MARIVLFIARQAMAIVLAALAYFGVRGLTEGSQERAYRNAERLIELERRLNLDVELVVQQVISENDHVLTVANWIYIFGHWPVIVATLVWLAVTRRDDFYDLRNAVFISGAIGLLIFATWAVMPPRLFSAQFMDTVTLRSNAYRVLQPPALINKYAAVPSLHFGWNLLVGIAWIRATSSRLVKIAGVLMPMAMAFAVVATANHWMADVVVGGMVAGTGWFLQRNSVRIMPPAVLTLVGSTKLARPGVNRRPNPAMRRRGSESESESEPADGLQTVRTPVRKETRLSDSASQR